MVDQTKPNQNKRVVPTNTSQTNGNIIPDWKKDEKKRVFFFLKRTPQEITTKRGEEQHKPFWEVRRKIDNFISWAPLLG